MKTSTAAFLSLLSLTTAQDLATALQGYPEASQFATQLTDIAGDLNTTSSKYTILVPTNQAFRDYAAKKGQSISSLALDQRQVYFRYHVLVGALTSSNFSAPRGLTVPTLLKGSQYNNRTAGTALTSKFGTQGDGQVLYIAKALDAASPAKFRVRRQTGAGGDAQVRSGLDSNTTLTAVDGTWSGGTFQIINQILEPPQACSKTIRGIAELAALDAALNKTSFWPQIDHTPNVTCLVPNTAAFAVAGNPQNTLSQSDLRAAIEMHTITTGTLYSDLITDGSTFKSMNSMTVKVTVNGSGTWFNDARVLQQNVLTNNGVAHVLDKLMSPINGEKLPAGNGSGSGSGSSTSKPSGAASVTSLLSQSYFAAMVGIIVALLL